MKSLDHFTANAASHCFTSVALKYKPYTHICGETMRQRRQFAHRAAGWPLMSVLYIYKSRG